MTVQEPAGRLIAERVYEELRRRIVTLELPPGAALREEELMPALGVGRTPLRDAIRRLSQEDLVVVRPRQGTAVTEVELSDIVHITEVRLDLEGYAAELAARRLSEADKARCEELLGEIGAWADGGDQRALMRLDERLHRSIWEASGNPYLAEILERQFILSLRVWYFVLDRVPGLGGSVQHQTETLHAILRRDSPAARELMRDHVLEFQREVLVAFGREMPSSSQPST